MFAGHVYKKYEAFQYDNMVLNDGNMQLFPLSGMNPLGRRRERDPRRGTFLYKPFQHILSTFGCADLLNYHQYMKKRASSI